MSRLECGQEQKDFGPEIVDVSSGMRTREKGRRSGNSLTDHDSGIFYVSLSCLMWSQLQSWLWKAVGIQMEVHMVELLLNSHSGIPELVLMVFRRCSYLFSKTSYKSVYNWVELSLLYSSMCCTVTILGNISTLYGIHCWSAIMHAMRWFLRWCPLMHYNTRGLIEVSTSHTPNLNHRKTLQSYRWRGHTRMCTCDRTWLRYVGA